MQKILFTLAIALSLVAGVFLLQTLNVKTEQTDVVGAVNPVENIRVATSATTSVGIYSATTVLSADPLRKVAVFSNYGATPIYICFKSACTVQNGILMTSSSTARLIDTNFPYTGVVTAIAPSATTTIQITYK